MRPNTEVGVERGVPYGLGKLLDVYRPPAGGGSAPTVLLWHGAGPDERDALAALATAAAGHGLTVVVPGLAVPRPRPGVPPSRTRAAPAPIRCRSGSRTAPRTRLVAVAASREFAALLAEKGWPVRLREQPTDHAGIIGIDYDPAGSRCHPATAPAAVAAGRVSARLLAEAAGITR